MTDAQISQDSQKLSPFFKSIEGIKAKAVIFAMDVGQMDVAKQKTTCSGSDLTPQRLLLFQRCWRSRAGHGGSQVTSASRAPGPQDQALRKAVKPMDVFGSSGKQTHQELLND